MTTTLIQAQERFIARVNSIRQPGKQACGAMYSRSYRAAAKELRSYLERIGTVGELQDAVVRDAADMAKLLKANDE